MKQRNREFLSILIFTVVITFFVAFAIGYERGVSAALVHVQAVANKSDLQVGGKQSR